MSIFRNTLTIVALVLLSACAENAKDISTDESTGAIVATEPVSLGYAVLNSFPHDTAAFTQGLELYNGKMLESTGLFNRSSLRLVDLKTGTVLKKIKNTDEIFAEGVTVFNDTIYQLSWENHLVFMYAAKDLKPIGTLPWTGQGWGITHDKNNLIISEGSEKLYFVEPGTLKLKKVLTVSDNFGSVNNINELEMVEGYIYANRWQYDYILKIDPESGFVVGRINMQDFLKRNSKADLSYLSKPGSTATESGAVLNGIAYDSTSKKLYITGKLWPEIFELSIN
jgi:glutamine cyclotransferase